MTTDISTRSQTPMERALAARALRLVEALEANSVGAAAGTATDLTAATQFDVPEHVRQAAKDALARGETHYTSRPGVVELREAIAQRVSAEGFPVTADSVVVTNGGAEGLYIALQAVLSAGDRIAMPEPIMPNVAAMIAFIGAELVRIPTSADQQFRPSVDALLESGASTILLASPSPITGVALSPEETRKLAAGAIERGTTLILDRSLAPAAYDPATVDFGDAERGAHVVTIGSFSAGFGLDGWRVGYFTAPKELLGEMRGLKQAMSICTTAVSQFAALAALEGPTDWLTERRSQLSGQRDEIVAILNEAGLNPVVPDAGQFFLIDVRAIDADDRKVASRLAEEAGVRVQPGSDFGDATAGFVRINLGAAHGDGIGAIRQIAAMATKGEQA